MLDYNFKQLYYVVVVVLKGVLSSLSEENVLQAAIANRITNCVVRTLVCLLFYHHCRKKMFCKQQLLTELRIVLLEL